MAAGDDHGRAVAGANIGQRDDDVALPAAEDTVGVQIATTQRTPIATGMHGMVPPRVADGGDALVNEQALDVALFFATVMAHIVDPTRIVDQTLERLAGFDAIVQFKASVARVIAALRIAPPLADLQGWKIVKGPV